MATSQPINSSWIKDVLYHNGFLALVTFDDTALLYGDNVPPWIPGLLCAGTSKRSPGLAYNRLVKGQYTYQKVEGKSKVSELVRLMEG